MIELPDADDELMRELGDLVARREPVPDSVLAAARGALAWRSVDADLAQLSADSGLALSASGMRGGGDRQLTFEGSAFTIEVDVIDGARHVVGQVVPPEAGPLDLEWPGRADAVRVDGDGRFEAPAHPGPFRMRFRPPAGPALVTDWVTL